MLRGIFEGGLGSGGSGEWLSPLEVDERRRLKSYVEDVKPAGLVASVVSLPADKVTLVVDVLRCLLTVLTTRLFQMSYYEISPNNMNAVWCYFFKGSYITIRMTANWSVGNQYIESIDCSSNIKFGGQLEANICVNLRPVNYHMLESITVSLNGIFQNTPWNSEMPTCLLGTESYGLSSFVRNTQRYNYPVVLNGKVYSLYYCFVNIPAYVYDIDTANVTSVRFSFTDMDMPLVKKVYFPNVLNFETLLRNNCIQYSVILQYHNPHFLTSYLSLS